MLEKRAYRRKSGSSAATVLLALSAAGLLFLILRPGADAPPVRQAAPPAPAEASRSALDAAQPPAEPKELTALRRQVEQASRDLDSLRSAAAEMRSELGALRQQREAMLHPTSGERAATVPASGPAETLSAKLPNTTPEPAAAAPAETKAANSELRTPAMPATAAKPVAAAQPAATAPPSDARQAAAPKPVRHAHNATGYLLSARDQLQSGNVSGAEDALERAETWALNSGGAAGEDVDPADDPLVGSIRRARADLRAGRSAAALRALDGMLPTVPRITAANRRDER